MSKGSSAVQDDAAYGWSPATQLTVPTVVQRLDQLIPSVQGNPDFLLTLAEFPRIALESSSTSGGKFWLGVAMESGVSIRWGRAGTAGTVKHFPLNQCKNSNPLLELKSRFMRKIGKGYNLNPHDTRIP